MVCQLEGAHEGAGLVPRLLELGRRIRVGHDTRACLQVRPPVDDDDGADRDAEVEIAREVEIADRARVDAAARRLERGDDLHRPDLGRPRHGTRRKARHQRVQPIRIVGQLSLDDRGEVHDVREALEGHELRHPDGAVLADAAHVVAAEIHEHHVLGPLLLVALQLFAEPHVLLFAAAAGARAGNGMGLHPAPLHPHEHLR